MAQSHILFVEDDQKNVALLTMALQALGYRVTSAANGLDALAAVAADRPDLIVLDVHMPVLNGAGFARRLDARGERIPLLVVSAAQGVGRWAGELGAVAILRKPFKIRE